MGAPETRWLKKLEVVNGKFERLVVDLTLDRSMQLDVLKQKW